MKYLKPYFFLNTLLFLLLFTFISCRKSNPPKNEEPPSQKVPIVSQFVYDGLSAYYLWANEMKNKTPKTTDTDPKEYFSSLLYSTDTEHGWSWMTDDVDALLAGFSGSPKDFGWSLSLLWANAEKTQIVGIVQYVYPNTPAAAAGIRRGDIIEKIAGAYINNTAGSSSNYNLLFAGNTLNIGLTDKNGENPKTINMTPVIIETNPVLLDTVYNIGGKKIGYLFYTEFIEEFNNDLYDAFAKFKSAGISDLIIDLRYNLGGRVTAASYLASLVAPQSAVQNKSVFTILNYNSFLNNYFDSQGSARSVSLGYTGTAPNPLTANLNLNKVYVIATSGSASASELTTFCLRPYMNVIHIGENTRGKFTGSWTIHAYDSYNNQAITIYDPNKLTLTQRNELKKWAMQPIVSIYSDKDNKNFSQQGYLVPNVPVSSIENKPSAWKPIGAIQDYMLATAITQITGVPVSGAVKPSSVPRSVFSAGTRLFSEKEKMKMESVNLGSPDIPLEKLKKVFPQPVQ